MARAVRAGTGSGPGLFGTIFSMVLALLLIGACAFLWVAYSRAEFARKNMVGVIEDKLDKPLVKLFKDHKLDLEKEKDPVSEPRDTPYGAKFFKAIADAAEKGLISPQLFNKLGWSREASLQELDKELERGLKKELETDPRKRRAKAGEKKSRATTLVDLLKSLRNKIISLEGEIVAIQDERNKAQAAQTAAGKRLEAANTDWGKKLTAANVKVDRVTKRLTREADRYKREADGSNARLRRVRAELESAKATRRSDAVTFKKRVDKGDAIIADLRRQLAKKFKRPVRVKYAKIIRIDPITKFAILDRGKRDGIEPGEKFTILKNGRDGKTVEKGQVRVVSVNELTSIVDIISRAARETITSGDKAKRHKQHKAPDEP